jgi:hypothetical protein
MGYTGKGEILLGKVQTGGGLYSQILFSILALVTNRISQAPSPVSVRVRLVFHLTGVPS